MKKQIKSTADYIKSYNLQSLEDVNKNGLINELLEEFIFRIVKNNGIQEYIKFNHSVTELKNKYNAIANKSLYNLSDEFWQFIYAAYISKIRDYIFPDYKFGHSPNNITITILNVVVYLSELLIINKNV